MYIEVNVRMCACVNRFICVVHAYIIIIIIFVFWFYILRGAITSSGIPGQIRLEPDQNGFNSEYKNNIELEFFEFTNINKNVSSPL